MSSTPDVLSASPRRQRRNGLARWWLAGLLVSCLLPASLHPSDALRSGERGVIICFWVPAMLRAQSEWIAKKRCALRRWVRKQACVYPAVSHCSRYFLHIPHRLVAAIDVLIPRGPPARLFAY
ncbi:hypothetical protein [Halomonas sp. TD01]|uniref:hypothetical protein n=1 Tax=Halomonas sp. TD01 TaxID=999141 RepID=UPI000214DE9B|nr:hypothetical protein [Halomonas sp. TD01]EGP21082.1 hypothetical protein GME_03777 [Halomonas sp. TD01]CAH1044197.1 hypothetical protein HPTD01_2675 [Halomonas sp. TD01]